MFCKDHLQASVAETEVAGGDAESGCRIWRPNFNRLFKLFSKVDEATKQGLAKRVLEQAEAAGDPAPLLAVLRDRAEPLAFQGKNWWIGVLACC